MRTEIDGNHARLVFNSLQEFIEHNAKKDYRSTRMSNRERDFFGGARDLDHALDMAREGLQREGIEALSIAAGQLKDLEGQLNYQAFSSEWHVSGTDVDVALYLAGEPECMIDYRVEDMQRPERVVSLVIGTAVPWMVSQKAIKLRGQKVVALIEAIEATGATTEIWADRSINATSGPKTARTSVRIKAPGDFYDSGSVMFAFTHAAYNRVLGWNADHSLPSDWHDAVGVGSFYGNHAGHTYRWEPDYPEGSTIIPPLKDDDDTFSVIDTLRKLNLIKD
ncbi:DUF7192 family protein [Mycobacteroides abscessus]|uniref:DUF7192 family protein n=1 Tax=Mycobacteroides abscessus TaxID=36809 RepID=UPI00092B4D95|nr:hypothetical protein [Mycobacteroides abscessus]SHY53861.1 Uncharacterised protein [Mycobacteroides abscessus subsp. abscessus]SHY63443.1 Uncharacterised protein [Mycobacteroides abscessus subsp. abscessus]SHY73504.1 Uncharacterised protein [Mycobacteroides abscessus subsp. abscessus]SIA14941.1 Uncharacterised protein [Mycobacteroides abscessus subsp. abscessus]SIB18193.1 Uncharacterised protein [Mycobacteroides abscessus subsp. abscessus]